ncbi:MAG: fasciclin domain-containing protein [Prevotella sp.]|nr:fasciclin domain-containing protein [Prevotella sp.]
MKTRKEFWIALLVGVFVLSSCQQYDLDENTPEGWGNSIYSWLDEQGNFTNTVRMINDLSYQEVLGKTGSKTLFVADDAAYDRFYGNNPWGVKRYEDLSLAQKKMLLFGNMIDNSIQLNSLSTIQGKPLKEGQAMRRFSALSEYDTIPVLKTQDMPDNKYWKRHRDSGKDMVCMEDGTAVPMLLFLEAQLSNNRITNEDYNFLFNHTTNRQSGDASVNGINVVEDNIRCANGFIHRTAEVVTPLTNMAELIAKKPQVSMFNKLLERFCAPYPDGKDLAKTERYNYLYGTSVDTVYTKRFFNEKNQVAVDRTPDGGGVPAQLLFDPEWNSYYSTSNKDNSEGNAAEQRDMAVMMVPSDDAMKEYWNGAGKPLSENYASWDDVPDDVIIKLLNVNMLPSFTSSVPSKFDAVLNDANDPMGVNVADIDSVWMSCNGAIYLTNKVYSPTAYVSVSFPALINRNMKIIDWAITQCKYNVYLNALGSDYSFFIPTNNALIEYIDPCSFGKPNLQLLSFRWDENKTNINERVYAVLYNYDEKTGERDSIGTVTNWNRITRCLQDILDTHIVIGKVWEGDHTYFRTKNGTGIRITNPKDESKMQVEGSYQMYEGQPLNVTRVYDQRKEVAGGNGKSYVLEGQPIMGTRLTVYDQLAAHPKYFGKFLELLEGSPLLETKHDMGTGDPNQDKACGGTNISVFNTYHYTIYVPDNEAIEQLQKEGKLSSWEEVDEDHQAGNEEKAASDSLNIVNFLKYHIQDNALYIGAQNESGDFETSLINKKTRRFYMVKSQLKDDEIEVLDAVDQQNMKDGLATTKHTVKKVSYIDDDGIQRDLYNIQAREYMYNNNDALTATELYTTSSAVIHLIDKPLSYSTDD